MRKAFEIIKIVVVCILLVSLVCLSVFYMNLYRSIHISEFTADMDEAVREKLYKASYVELIDESLVSPYFVGYSFDGDRTGFFGSGAGDIYKTVSDVVSSFFGPSGRVSVIDEAVFSRCLSGNFVYIRYRFELPRSLIYYMQNTENILENISDEYVFDMFIVPSGRQAYAAVRDMRGNFYMYSSDDVRIINKNTFNSYTESDGGIPFLFVDEYEADAAFSAVGFHDKLDPFDIITDSDITAMSAVIESGELPGGDFNTSALLSLGMNPEKITSFEDEEGITYFDEGENLRLRSGGVLVYSALSPQYGISLDSIIGYDFSGKGYSITDCVGAALVLADKLGIYGGSDFSFAVTCAENDGENITVGISYVYDGFSVMTDSGYALKIEVSEGHITSVVCSFMYAHVYDGVTTLPYNSWRLRSAVVCSGGKIMLEYAHAVRNSRLYLTLVSFERTEG